ncbi:MAG: hypothetical protein HQ581_13440, partial [Planctomycetes bacterium]|nr:hypothetical protein [Planctomycetota bacterium]
MPARWYPWWPPLAPVSTYPHFFNEPLIAQQIDLKLGYADSTQGNISALRVPTYLCPSETNDKVR